MFKKLFKRTPSKSPAERFLDHWSDVFAKEPEIFHSKSENLVLPGVSSLVFRDVPERGMLTAVTYGLSLASHPDWKLGRPELMLSVESDDALWGESIAYLANRLRGNCPFSYGNTIDFQGEIHPASEMGAFLIFAPAAARKEDCANLDIGLKYKIHVAGAYPIHTSEIKLIQDWGLERFWKHPLFNMRNPGRPRLG